MPPTSPHDLTSFHAMQYSSYPPSEQPSRPAKGIRTGLRCQLAVLLAVCSLGRVCLAAQDNRHSELTSADFRQDWVSVAESDFPRAARPAFLKWAGEDLEDYPERMYQFIFVDLNGDGRKEMIVADPASSGSGGKAYFILQQVEKSWRVIGAFQGDFILTLRDISVKFPYYRIISYSRIGDTYQKTYDYREGRYRLTGQTIVPAAIADSKWWRVFWEDLNSVYATRKGGTASSP